MKVLTPLAKSELYEPLVQAGADEFYCGFVTYEWLKNYTNSNPISRREYLLAPGTFNSYSTMKILQRKIEEYKVPIKIAFNAHYYVKSQYPMMKDIIIRLIDLGFTNFIIADLALMSYLKENDVNCQIHVSGEFGVTNQLSISFLKQFNVSRIVFPRKTTISEMESCIKNTVPEMEFESFILNSLCRYSGAYCNTIHCDELVAGCDIPYNIIRYKNSDNFKELDYTFELMKQLRKSTHKTDVRKEDRNEYQIGNDGCGLCRIWKLKQIGVTHLKVVGRDCIFFDQILKDIRSIKEMLQLINTNTELNQESFEKHILENYMKDKCSSYCYYPDL